MNDARDAWKNVGEQVEALGLKLKRHLEQEKDAAVASRAEGDTRNAFDELSGTVSDAFDAIGNAAKDDAVLSDVRDIAELIKQALIETFQAVGAEAGDLIDQIEDYAEGAAESIAGAVSVDIDLDDDEVIEVTAEPAADDDGAALDRLGTEVADEL